MSDTPVCREECLFKDSLKDVMRALDEIKYVLIGDVASDKAGIMERVRKAEDSLKDLRPRVDALEAAKAKVDLLEAGRIQALEKASATAIKVTWFLFSTTLGALILAGLAQVGVTK